MATPRRRPRFTPFLVDNAWIVEFPTEPAGVLRLGPGRLRIHARLSERMASDDRWYAVLDCQLRLADDAGKLWQATASFRSDWLFYPVIDLPRDEPGRWLHKASEDWRQALRHHALIRNIPATYDDRFYRYVWLDNTGFCWQFKYLGATFDIAALTADRLLVRVDNVFCSWNPVPVAGPDGAPLPLPPPRPPLSEEEREEEEERQEASGESGDFDKAPPVAYLLDAGRLLFRNTAWHDDEEGWADLPVSRPLVFQRVKGKGEAQSAVSHDAHHHPRVLPSSDAEDAPTFLNREIECWVPLELGTDARGFLRVEHGAKRWSVCLERHPDIAREPVDVLRCWLRLADEAGDVWEARVHFTPDLFFEKLVDIDRTSAPGFETVESAWQAGPGAIQGIRALLDDGAWRYCLLWEDLIAFRAAGQKPRVDVCPTDSGWHVRINGLIGRRRPIDIDHESRYLVLDPENRVSESARWEHEEPLPAITYTLSFHALAFRNTTFAVDDGFWHGNAIPIPVVFTRVGKGEPQEGVRFILAPTGTQG